MWPHKSVYEDTIERRVYPNWSGPVNAQEDDPSSVPAENHPGWISGLTSTFKMRLYDCTDDFLVPASNLAMLSLPTGVTASEVVQGQTFRYQIGTGIHYLDVTIPA